MVNDKEVRERRSRRERGRGDTCTRERYAEKTLLLCERWERYSEREGEVLREKEEIDK